MKPRIAYTKPSITELEVRYATDAAANGWGEQCYAYIGRFENSYKEHLGVKHAIATSSCTGALHMGMAALGIGPGDEVIMADTNWIASAAPIVHLGAKPVFVDILPESWCVDPELAEAAITPRTKAILAVHLYGNLCEMDRLLAIGEKHGIPVIEDAAEAIGSIYYGKRAGSMGCFGTFSFHGTKTVTTGEGGMFVTNDDDLYESAHLEQPRTRTQPDQAVLARHGGFQVQDLEHPGGHWLWADGTHRSLDVAEARNLPGLQGWAGRRRGHIDEPRAGGDAKWILDADRRFRRSDAHHRSGSDRGFCRGEH